MLFCGRGTDTYDIHKVNPTQRPQRQQKIFSDKVQALLIQSCGFSLSEAEKALRPVKRLEW